MAIALLGLGTVACKSKSPGMVATDDAGTDAGVDAAAVTRTRAIVLGTSTPINLHFLETTPLLLQVVSLSDNLPVSGAAISLELFNAQSISLDSAALTTDVDGLAQAQISAGQDEAMASLRITVEGADGVVVPVNVLPNGTAILNVGASYLGTRHLDTYVVDLFQHQSCAQISPADLGEKTQSVTGASTPAFRFLGLAEDNYAVRLLAASSAHPDLILAYGCLDVPSLNSGGTTSVYVPIDNAPVAFAGFGTVALTVTSESATTPIANAFASTITTLGGVEGHLGVPWLLRAMATPIAASGAGPAWTQLTSDSSFVTNLEASLAYASAGPDPAATAISAYFSPFPNGLVLHGSLDLNPDGLTADLHISRAGVLAPMGSAVAETFLDDLGGSFASTLDGMFVDPVDPASPTLALQIDKLTVRLPYGSLAMASANDRGMGDMAFNNIFHTTGGCDIVTMAVAHSLAPACDGACVRAACMNAYGMLGNQLASSVRGLDPSLSTLVLTGIATATDSDSDGVIDVLSSGERALTGGWSAGPTSTVELQATGSLAGTESPPSGTAPSP